MTTQTWDELYKTGSRQSVPAGAYQVQVAAARPYPQGKLLFLDLEILTGPEAGNTAQVNLFVPAPSEKGGFFFQRKVAGALEGPPPGFAEALENGERDRALEILAGALEGRTFEATLSVRTDGDYAGTNELQGTKPSGGAAPAPRPAPAPEAKPVEDDDVPF